MTKIENRENRHELSPEEAYYQLLDNKLDSVEISLCSSDSSVSIIKDGEPIYHLTAQDYNSSLVNRFRFIFQKIIEDPAVDVLSNTHSIEYGLGKAIYEISISSKDQVCNYSVESSGISNKFNCLIIRKL